MHRGEPGGMAEGSIPPSVEAMEQGVSGADAGVNGTAFAPEGRYYTRTPSPAFQAVKQNINHMSGLNLGLRIAVFIFSVIAFSVMASANQNGAIFNNFTSYSFVLAVNVLVFLYSLGQIVMSIMLLVAGEAPNKNYLFVTFGCDQLFAFLLMAAGAAGASLALVLNHQGVLDSYGNGCRDGHITVFCSQAEASIAFTFLAFFCTLLSSLLSGYSLAPYLIL